ncbi:hypothetical protein ACFL3Q_15105, partial [Planctomycetota bacterium]
SINPLETRVLPLKLHCNFCRRPWFRIHVLLSYKQGWSDTRIRSPLLRLTSFGGIGQQERFPTNQLVNNRDLICCSGFLQAKSLKRTDIIDRYSLAHSMSVITTFFGKKYAKKVVILWIKAPSILA